MSVPSSTAATMTMTTMNDNELLYGLAMLANGHEQEDEQLGEEMITEGKETIQRVASKISDENN